MNAGGVRRVRPLLVVGLSVALIPLAIADLDRPVAEFLHSHLGSERQWFDALTHIVDPLVPISTTGLLVGALASWFGWQAGRTAKVAFALCLAIALAITLKEQAKFAFGRLWPETWVDNNSSWIGSRSYGFSPFHGGRGWASIPSGHTAVITAPAAVLWHTVPRLRWLAALGVALVAVGLLGADYHFLSDVVAGCLLGTACGAGAVRVVELGWKLNTSDQEDRRS